MIFRLMSVIGNKFWQHLDVGFGGAGVFSNRYSVLGIR